MAKTLERAALGRSGHLGALYDCRTDSFQGNNVFNTKLDDDLDIYPTELPNTTVELLMTDSLEDKFYKLNIEAELSVSVLSGLVKLSGSACYLNEKRTTAKKSCMSLIYNVTTRNEEIILRQLKDKINYDALDTTDATHVLTGIDWGAMCTVTAEYEFSDEDEKKEIEGGLKAELNMLKGVFDLKGEAKAEFNEALKEKQHKFKFYSKCDVGGRGDDLPITFDEAVNQAKQLPSLVTTTNEGRGVPLKFTFTPLELIRKWFQLEKQVHVIYKTIREESLKRIVQLTQSMTDTRQRLNDLHNDIVQGGKFCISDDQLDNVVQLVLDFDKEEARFRHQLQGLLEDIRSGKKEVSELDKLTSEFEAGRFSTKRMNADIGKWQNILNKISTIIKLQQTGVRYYGKSGAVDNSEKEEIFVFYAENIQHQDENLMFFLKLKDSQDKAQKDVLFCIIDLEVNPNIKDAEKFGSKIIHIKSGRMVSTDYKAEYQGGSLIEFVKGDFVPSIPLNRAKVYLKCPGNIHQETQCSAKEKEWLCSVCKEPMLYGIATKLFYCEKCHKKCEPSKSHFRCDEEEHGFFFLQYPIDHMNYGLSLLRESYDINILILGETGVGKSTWINAFANYLYFSNLDDAVQGNRDNPIVAIPSKFTVFDSDGEQKTIFVGKQDANEKHEDGVSNTQEARTYPFKIGNDTINLIDTPGIGDTKGIKQDDKNMESILSHLTFYTEIHAILVLLKPNNARLGIFFKHCIQQLLAHLHKDAANNIAFVFTNTRSTFYNPGETLPALRALLTEKELGIEAVKSNIFCFDNEAFRFLGCTLQGMEFGSDVRADYEKSWDRAVAETQRLLQYTMKMEPHQVQNTLTLNDARRIIVLLSRPLQEFAETIKKNLRYMQEQQSQAESLGKNANDFRAKLSFDGVTLEQRTLGFPRTVCTHTDCVEYIACGKDNISQINYKTHCHEHCGLGGSVRPETVGDERLMRCAAMRDNFCTNCGHSYNRHMHRTYDLLKVNKKFTSPEVQAKIDKATTEKEKTDLKVQELADLVDELKQEDDEICQIGAGFAAFLKTYAIIPFNDAMGEYIETQIMDEQTKLSPDKKVIADLKKYQQEYEKKKSILISALGNAIDTSEGNSCAAQSVKQLEQKAYNLKHFGKDIKKVVDDIGAGKSHKAHFRHGYVPTQPLKREAKGALQSIWNACKNWATG